MILGQKSLDAKTWAIHVGKLSLLNVFTIVTESVTRRLRERREEEKRDSITSDEREVGSEAE